MDIQNSNNIEIIRSNKTARSSGAVGRNAILPRMVIEKYQKNLHVLDYGSGPNMIHSKKLKSIGYEHVDSFDFGNNWREGMQENIKSNFYDLVFASNVFNTHSSFEMSNSAIVEIYNSLKDGGFFLVNLPKSPRFFWTTDEFSDFLATFRLTTIGFDRKKLVWTLQK